MIFDADTLSATERQYYLQHVIGPRPIGLVSTIDSEGRPNLSPFSFFNLFSSAPPIVIFSPARRLRDNTTKHTLENVLQVPEVVIHIVTFKMVEQASLASTEYDHGVDEFVKAGFTKQPATKVKPPMVKESPVKLECKVLEVKSLGDQGGAGQLVICEVIYIHIDDYAVDKKGRVELRRLDLVARLGDDWYCRVIPRSLFKVTKPSRSKGIGVDNLPGPVRSSHILTGGDLARLAGVTHIPHPDSALQCEAMSMCRRSIELKSGKSSLTIHHAARYLLRKGKVDMAWQILLLEQ